MQFSKHLWITKKHKNCLHLSILIIAILWDDKHIRCSTKNYLASRQLVESKSPLQFCQKPLYCREVGMQILSHFMYSRCESSKHKYTVPRVYLRKLLNRDVLCSSVKNLSVAEMCGYKVYSIWWMQLLQCLVLVYLVFCQVGHNLQPHMFTRMKF
jgi:hypothetical protein